MNDKNEILHVYREYLDAMVAGDTEKIAEFITDDFVLVRITGYEQPGEEWLREMGQGQFICYFTKI